MKSKRTGLEPSFLSGWFGALVWQDGRGGRQHRRQGAEGPEHAVTDRPSPVSEHTHDGPPSRTAYKRGCRHPDCRAENTAYLREYRGESTSRQRAVIGTRACYVRCVRRPEGPHPECRETNRRYQGARRSHVPFPARPWRVWTPADDEVLLECGDDLRHAAERLDRSFVAVRQRRLRLRTS